MIAVYDSGVGGLSPWQRLRNRFPREDLVYFADTAHLPYGEKTPACLRYLAQNALDFLSAFSPRKILVACGTVSATILPGLCQTDPRLMGVISPTAQKVIETAQKMEDPKILVLATPRTVASDAYAKAIRLCLPNAKICSVACPAFVPALEGTPLSLPARANLCAQTLSAALPAALPDPDILVLGCTHYPLLYSAFARRFPYSTILDAGTVAADALPPGDGSDKEEGQSLFYATGDASAFAARARSYGFPVEKAVQVSVG